MDVRRGTIASLGDNINLQLLAFIIADAITRCVIKDTALKLLTDCPDSEVGILDFLQCRFTTTRDVVQLHKFHDSFEVHGCSDLHPSAVITDMRRRVFIPTFPLHCADVCASRYAAVISCLTCRVIGKCIGGNFMAWDVEHAVGNFVQVDQCITLTSPP